MLKKLSSFFLLTTVVLPFSLSSCGNKTNIVSDSFNLNYFNKFNPTKNKYFHKFPTRDYTTGIYSGATNDQNIITTKVRTHYE